MDNVNIDRKKNTLGFITGLIIMIFAVIGVVSLVRLGITAIRQGKEEKQLAQFAEYNEFLIPAAAIDIKPFDDITHASMPELVEMAVWSILNSELEPSAYQYADGRLVIPAAQVKTEFEHFFGTELPITHGTVEGYGYEFTYDATNDVYYIPFTTITPIYTPRVTDVEKKGNTLTVTCGLSNASLWTQDKLTGDMNAPAPDKFIKVTLRSIGKEVYISAIQATGTPETAATAFTEAPAVTEGLTAADETASGEQENAETETQAP